MTVAEKAQLLGSFVACLAFCVWVTRKSAQTRVQYWGSAIGAWLLVVLACLFWAMPVLDALDIPLITGGYDNARSRSP